MAGPYIFPTEATSRQWQADVKAQGGVVTVIPRGLNQGAFAARFPNVDGLPPSSYTYVLAPEAVLIYQFGTRVEAEWDARWADWVIFVHEIGGNIAENLGDIVGDIGGGLGKGLGGALVGWWWLLAAVGVGAYIFRDELHGVARRHLSRL